MPPLRSWEEPLRSYEVSDGGDAAGASGDLDLLVDDLDWGAEFEDCEDDEDGIYQEGEVTGDKLIEFYS